MSKGPLTDFDADFQRILAAHTGDRAGEINFLNTVFSFVRRKSSFFQQPNAAAL
jgi:hypothetical protein